MIALRIIIAIAILLGLAVCALGGWLLGWLTDPDHDDLTWTGKRKGSE